MKILVLYSLDNALVSNSSAFRPYKTDTKNNK